MNTPPETCPFCQCSLKLIYKNGIAEYGCGTLFGGEDYITRTNSCYDRKESALAAELAAVKQHLVEAQGMAEIAIKRCGTLTRERDAALSEVAALRGALEIFADIDNWIEENTEWAWERDAVIGIPWRIASTALRAGKEGA